MNKKAWTSPALINYGSATKITQQSIVDFSKKIGSGDSILVIVNGAPSTINVPTGGSLINITVNGVPR